MRGEGPPDRAGPGRAPGEGTGGCRRGDGPLVLWASQTGNAEDFAARLARRLGDSQLVNMDEMCRCRGWRPPATF